MKYQSFKDVTNALIQAYFYDKNIDDILSCVSDNIEWISIDNSVARGIIELKKIILEYINSSYNLHTIEIENYNSQELSKDVVAVIFYGRQIFKDSILEIRGSLCCVNSSTGWKIANVHISNANINNRSLNIEKEKQLALLQSVRGGLAIYRVKTDGRIATDYVSDGLARICGYDNGADIMKVMEYDSRVLVIPEDFPVVAAACKQSLEKGIPTSVNYRIYSKDGTPVRLTLDSIVMKNVYLNDDDVAVFYAVQTLVSDENNKIIEERKFMASLLNAVPAGIGIYEVDNDKVSLSYMNDAFYKMVGSNRENRLNYFGENATKSIHPDDLKEFWNQIRKVKAGENFVQIELRLKKDNGQWMWIHASGSIEDRKDNYFKMYTAFYDCTDTKEKQLLLIQNQHAVELAQNQGSLAIWTYNIDRHTLIQQTPMNVEGHLGYPVLIDDVPNCFIKNNAIYPDDINKFLDVYNQLDKGIDKIDVTYRIMNQQTGKYNWVHMFYQIMENNDLNERIAAGFSMDIDKEQKAIERYQVEQRLREQMYKDAELYIEYNLMTNSYKEQNNPEQYHLSNKWKRLSMETYRENMSTVVAKPYLDIVVEKMYSKNLLKAFNNGITKVSCQFRSLDRVDKPSLWYNATATMIQSLDTGDVMAFIYVINIEKEKQVQLAIESSMSDGVESVAVIRIKDRITRIIRTNSSAIPKDIKEYFIYDDEFVNRSHKAVIKEDNNQSKALLSKIIEELANKDIYQYSISMVNKEGLVKRRLFKFRYLDDRKNEIVMSISDITSIYLEEQEKKKQLEDALLKLKKASGVKADFYSRMSHDMRTPMNGILGMTELSKDEEDINVLKENIKKIHDSGEYLLGLVNDTLDIQRMESGRLELEPKIVYIQDIIDNIIDIVKINAKSKGVTLKYDKGNTELNWYIRVDELRLKQIFINLLSNAIKFTSSGGTVEMVFKLLKREGMIFHDVIYIRDTGVGMSKEFLKDGIFKPFCQESNIFSSTYAGSGLGLSICKSLVELMGGHIEVESEQGVGSTFYVYLDFEIVDNETAKKFLINDTKVKENVSATLQGKKILLVEDHPLNAEITTKLLNKVGCNVTWAKNGMEAIDYIKKAKKDDYEVVLMDIRMPVMDGLQASRQIRSLVNNELKDIPIIAMTANSYKEDIDASFKAGMNAHLSKPIETELLYKTIISVLKGD